VSQLKFGERFFSNRDRVAQVWEKVIELANSSGIHLDEMSLEETHKDSLEHPFVFTVIGEVNCGKSSLINSLFNHALCPFSTLPETSEIIRYRYGTKEANQPAAEITDIFHGYDFLRDFHIIDTPGTNVLDSEKQDQIRALFSKSDLIFVTFLASNPWGAATWNLISNLSQHEYERMVFIIQQTDKQEDVDIPIILNHISDLSIKRIGLIPETIPVSAKLAAEAKSDTSPNQALHEKSGFKKLEGYIANFINNRTTRAHAVKKWHDFALKVVSSIEQKIEKLKRLHSKQNDFLGSLEDEIDKMRESLVSRLPRHLKEVAEVFETEAFHVTRQLKKWLGIRRSLVNVFTGDETGAQIESVFIDRLRIAVEAVAENDAQDVVVACLNHWQELGIRVRKEIGPSIDQSVPIEDALEQAKQRFMQRIGSTAHQAIGSLHVRKDLERELRTRLTALKSFTASTLIFLSLGAITGILEIPLLPWILCSIAGAFFLVGSVIALMTGSRISNDFKLSLLNTCGQFADTLRYDYEDALRLFFQEYTSCLNAIRKHLAEEKQSIEPMAERRQKLLIELKSIEAGF
jgi:GTPase SAR1 family protein